MYLILETINYYYYFSDPRWTGVTLRSSVGSGRLGLLHLLPVERSTMWCYPSHKLCGIRTLMPQKRDLWEEVISQSSKSQTSKMSEKTKSTLRVSLQMKGFNHNPEFIQAGQSLQYLNSLTDFPKATHCTMKTSSREGTTRSMSKQDAKIQEKHKHLIYFFTSYPAEATCEGPSDRSPASQRENLAPQLRPE